MGAHRRVHHEDYFQALSVHPDRKYEADGGPGTREIGQMLAGLPRSNDRADAARAAFEQTIFNVAIGNPDAHGKNYSVVLRGPSVRQAPLDDAPAARHTPTMSEGAPPPP